MTRRVKAKIDELRQDYKAPWIRVIVWRDGCVTGWPFPTRAAARAAAREEARVVRDRFLDGGRVFVVRG